MYGMIYEPSSVVMKPEYICLVEGNNAACTGSLFYRRPSGVVVGCVANSWWPKHTRGLQGLSIRALGKLPACDCLLPE